MSTLDDVIETVLGARADGPDALAAVAMSFGAAMELGTLGNTALKARLAEARAALEATEATVTTLRAERDAARDTAAQAAEVSGQATRDWDTAFDALCKARAERDAAQAEAKAARESAADAAEVWRLRESVVALRAERDAASAAAKAARDDAEMCARQRDEARARASMLAQDLARAVQEREAFSLRASAAERERDEARAERDAMTRARDLLSERVGALRAALDAALARPTYEARTTMPTPEERGAHLQHGARWLRATPHHVSITHLHRTESVEHLDGATWIPLGASGLPCAWPVPAGEVSP